MKAKEISSSTLARLPEYLTLLKSLPESSPKNISSAAIAARLGYGEIQVRKDLAQVANGGRPRVGYEVCDLTRQLESFLGYNDVKDAVIVGCGKLGLALLDYPGFSEYGINIRMGFDANEELAGETRTGKFIFPVSRMKDLCQRMEIELGILAVPAERAEAACQMMTIAGIRAILNFAPTHLAQREGVIIRNENIAVSLTQLAFRLMDEEETERREGHGEKELHG